MNPYVPQEGGARRQADQALAVPATPASAVDGPSGFDPSRTIKPLPKGLMELIRVQNFRCAYCHKAFLLNGERRSPRAPTVEHVRPRRHGHSRVGNVVAVHKRCNEAKGDRLPTGCELITLEVINAKRPQGCVGLLPGATQ